MPWFPVDDRFHSHPKAVAAGTPALGLWVRAGSWCSEHLTDGFVPEAIARLYGTKTMATALVRVGLWHRVDGGYAFHEWEAEGRNLSRADVERKRKEKANRQARWREQRKKTAAQDVDGDECRRATGATPVDAPVDAGETRVRRDGDAPVTCSPTNTHPIPIPSHPTEVLRTSVEGGVGGDANAPGPPPSPPAAPPAPPVTPTTSTRGIRLPDGWTPPPDVISAMRTECPGFDLQVEHRRFVDYWQAQPGQKGVKAGERGWQATWRNWMRRSYTDQRRPAGTAPSAPRGKPTMDDIVRENAIRYEEMRRAEQAEDIAREDIARGGRP